VGLRGVLVPYRRARRRMVGALVDILDQLGMKSILDRVTLFNI
jgi:hypothetical protein